MAAEKLTPHRVCQALAANHGLITPAAEALHCSRQTIHNYIQRYDVCRTALEDGREQFLDTAEQKLAEAVEAGEMRAVIFTLKTLGRVRGYSEEPLPAPPPVHDKPDLSHLTTEQLDNIIALAYPDRPRRPRGPGGN
jgi:hypothetical protein